MESEKSLFSKLDIFVNAFSSTECQFGVSLDSFMIGFYYVKNQWIFFSVFT